MAGDDGSSQLISFFVYSLFIYPITNYLVSPTRGYPRWKGAIYAVVFLLSVTTLHMIYENMENGPNHYSLLNVSRSSNLNVLKKAYRNLSLELHPDKNKKPSAIDDFRKVKNAFDVLSNKEKRREYNRLGDNGVKISSQSVIDHKYIIIQLIVYYASSAIFAFLMTFSEPNGESMSLSFFGLLTMLMLEAALVIQEFELPGWFLPYYTPYEMISTAHRLFPAYMNACRCVTGAFYVDKRKRRVEVLEQVSAATRDVSLKTSALVRSFQELGSKNSSNFLLEGQGEEGEEMVSNNNNNSFGVMASLMQEVKLTVSTSKEFRDGLLLSEMKKKVDVISDVKLLSKMNTEQSAELYWLRNVLIYLIVRFVFIKSKQEV